MGVECVGMRPDMNRDGAGCQTEDDNNAVRGWAGVGVDKRKGE